MSEAGSGGIAWSQRVLLGLFDDTYSLTGRGFHRRLVRSLASILRVSHALVAAPAEDRSDQFRTLAYWADGSIQPDMAYTIAGTPCEQVSRGKPLLVRRGLIERFSSDEFLRQNHLVSYSGVPLLDPSGGVIGHLAILDHHPLTDGLETIPAMLILADRAAVELQRASAERKARRRTLALEAANRALRAEMKKRKRAEALHAGHARVLDRLATGAALEEVLDELVGVIEQIGDGLIGAVLLREGDYLHIAAAPRLAPAFRTQAPAIRIAPGQACCGEAAFYKRRAICENTSTDPRWKRLARLAESNGIRASWSHPVLSAGGEVLGTFAMFYHRTRRPSVDELELIEEAANLAAIAIERKRAEDEMRRRQGQLEHVARVSTMGEMASGLAHELNQPLCAISTYARALERMRSRQIDVDKQFETISKIVDQADRAGHIIRQMRRHIRRQPLERTTVNLNDCVRAVAGLLRPQLRDARVRVTCALAEPLPPVWADRVRIEQVLMNLIRNAVEAMEPVPATSRQLAIESSCCDGHVTVSVRDWGPPIGARQLAHLFEAFQTTKPDGLGLGLSISRSIIEDAGGHILARPQSPQGLCVTFTLPIARTGQRTTSRRLCSDAASPSPSR